MFLTHLWAALVLSSCVVRYGDPVESAATEPLPAPVTFAEIESRLDQLLVGMEDIDRVERLRAARSLASQMKTQDPRAQLVVLNYLQSLVEIEERANPLDVWTQTEAELSLKMPEISEEPLDGPGPTGAPSARVAPQAGEPDVAAAITTAREKLAAGRPKEAMDALEVCLGRACWAEVGGLWSHARDLHVYQRREEAAEMFLRARAEPDPELKLKQLRAVEEDLYKLLAEYPNTRYAPAIQRNVTLVQREIALLTGK